MAERAVSAPATESVSVSLRRPLGTLSELVIRRPTAGDLRGLPMRVLRAEGGRKTGATWGDLLAIVASCSGVTLEALDALSGPDAVAAVEVLNGFLALHTPEAQAKRTRKLDGGQVVVTLARPLQLGKTKLETLELQPLSAKHLRDTPVEPGIGDLLELAGRLALQPAAIVDRLDVEDALLLIEVAAGFFADSRATGG